MWSVASSHCKCQIRQLLKMVRFPTLKGSWPWPWIIPLCITHRHLPTCQISLKSKKLFVDGRMLRTYIQTFETGFIRSTLWNSRLGRLSRRVDLKMRCFGVWVLEVTGNSAIQQSAHEFLLASHSNYVTILHCFWDISRYWSKIADCKLPTTIWHPTGVYPLGISPISLVSEN